jgi:hypothetical protein
MKTRHCLLASLFLTLAPPLLRGQLPPTGGGLVVDVLLDSSRTIKGPDLRAARRLVLDLFDELPPGTRVGVSTFGSRRLVLEEPTSDRELLDDALNRIRLRLEHQDLSAVLPEAAAGVGSRPGGRWLFLLVTDGVSLPFPSRRPGDPLNRLVSRIKAAGVPFFVVDTRGSRSAELKTVAGASGGRYELLDEAQGFLLARSMIGRAGAPQPEKAPGSGLKAPRPEGSPSRRPLQPSPPAASAAPLPAWLWLSIAGAALLGGCMLGLRLAQQGRVHPRPPQQRDELPADASTSAAQTHEPPAITAGASPSWAEVPQAVQPKGRLRLTLGKGEGNVFPLAPTGMTLVGRSKLADVTIVDPLVGPEHFRIVSAAAGLTLHAADDLPTSVNGVRVYEHVLSPGDVIGIGSTQLEFLPG